MLSECKSNHQVKVAFETLGCKLNQAETELLSRQLQEAGCCIVPPREKADIYVLNTCTVTHVADRKSRHLLRIAHQQNPGAKIIALGCYAERVGNRLAEIEGVDLVAGNRDKINLAQLLKDRGYLARSSQNHANCEYGRTRSFIKAQDGCNHFCSYCIVPLVRGREKSLPIKDVLRAVEQRVSEGFKEVVITGTEIGRYRYEGVELPQLLEAVLSGTGVQRLRVSSLQPQEITPQLIRLWQDRRLCRHFHLSLQSGSDSVLQRMNRRYNTREYHNCVDMMRSKIPDVAITSDVIVGFPGETEVEFSESYDFFSRLEFSRIHVFPFSVRAGTAAAQMPGQIEAQIKKQRTAKMLLLARSSLERFNQKFLHHQLPVLFEQRSNSFWSGLTDNYIKVYVESDKDLTNQILPVTMLELEEDGIRGEISS